jgi:hypothetical protein
MDILSLFVDFYAKLGYKYYNTSSVRFLTLALNEWFPDDLRSSFYQNLRLKVLDAGQKFIRTEATDIRVLVESLHVYDILGIVKDDNRKNMLLKLK